MMIELGFLLSPRLSSGKGFRQGYFRPQDKETKA